MAADNEFYTEISNETIIPATEQEKIERELDKSINVIDQKLAETNFNQATLEQLKNIIFTLRPILTHFKEYTETYADAAELYIQKYNEYQKYYAAYAEALIKKLNERADEKMQVLVKIDFKTTQAIKASKATTEYIPNLEDHTADVKILEQAISQIEDYQTRFPDVAENFNDALEKYKPIVDAYNKRLNELTLEKLLSFDTVETVTRKLTCFENMVTENNLSLLTEESGFEKLFKESLRKVDELRQRYAALNADPNNKPLTKLENLIALIDTDYYTHLRDLVFYYEKLQKANSKRSKPLPAQEEIIQAAQLLPSLLPALSDLLKVYSKLNDQENIQRIEALQARFKEVIKKMNLHRGSAAFINYDFTGVKTRGANDAGEHGGWLKHTITGKLGLAKKDPKVEKVIAEKLAGDLISATTGFAAKIDFIQTTPGIDETGDKTYVFSHKVDGFQGDLWELVYKHAGYSQEDIPDNRPKMVGSSKTKQGLLRNYLDHLETKNANIKQEFAEIMAASLWTGDFDVHWGNIIVAYDANNIPHLHRIDYGAAFSNLVGNPEIHPHSRARHVPGLGPTNHFREFRRDWRVSKEMVVAIENLTKFNIEQQVTHWIAELDKLYAVTPLQKFAKLYGVSKIPEDKTALLNVLKEQLTKFLETRRNSLLKFGREIELSLCVDANNQIDGTKIKAFVAKDPTYAEAILKNQKFHFRSKGQHGLLFRRRVQPKVFAALEQALEQVAQIPIVPEKVEAPKETYKNDIPTVFDFTDDDFITLYNRGEKYELFCDKVLSQTIPEAERLKRIHAVMDKYIEGSVLALAEEKVFQHEPFQADIYDAMFDLMQRHFSPEVASAKKPIDKQINLALLMYKHFLVDLEDLEAFDQNGSELKESAKFLKIILGTEKLSLELINEVIEKRKTEPSYLPSETMQRVVKQLQNSKSSSDDSSFAKLNQSLTNVEELSQRVKRFAALDLSMLPQILSQVHDYLSQYNAEDFLGTAEKNMSLFDAFTIAFPRLKDELGLVIDSNRKQDIIAAVNEFLLRNKENKSHPFKAIVDAANIIYSVNELSHNRETIVEKTLSENTLDAAYGYLYDFFTMGAEHYSQTGLYQSFKNLILLVENSECTKDKVSTQSLRETHYQLNVLAQECITGKPEEAKPIQQVDTSVHYSTLLLKLNNAIHLQFLEDRIRKILLTSQSQSIKDLQQLLNALRVNRMAALTLVDPDSDQKLAFADLIVSLNLENKPIDVVNYLQKNLSKLTRQQFDQLLEERAKLLAKAIQLLHDNASEKLAVQSNEAGTTKQVSIEKIFMQDQQLDENAATVLGIDSINLLKSLQNELSTINQLRQISEKELIRQILGDIQNELKEINRIHVLPKQGKDSIDPIKIMPLAESMKLLENFDNQVQELKQKIAEMSDANLAEIEKKTVLYESLFSSIQTDLESIEWNLKKLEAELVLLQTFRQEGIAELQPHEKLIEEYTKRRDALKQEISTYRETFSRHKSTFLNLQGDKSYMFTILTELMAKVENNTATITDFYQLLRKNPKFLILHDDPNLQQHFNVIYREFISRDAAALVKTSRELFLTFKREDLLTARTDRAKHADSSFFSLTEFFNYLSRFVAQDILLYADINQRTLAVKHWVDVAMSAVHKHGDFNVAIAINAAFTNAAITRLKSTMDSCDQETKEKLQQLDSLSATTNSYKNHREAIANSKGAFVPYSGVLASDMTFNNDGNPWVEEIYLDSNILTPIEKKAKKLETYTAAGYGTGLLFDIAQELIANAPQLNEFNSELLAKMQTREKLDTDFDQQCFDQSLILEPREKENPKSELLQSIDSKLLVVVNTIPRATNNKTTRQLLSERCAIRAADYFTKGGLDELEQALSDSLTQSAAEALGAVSKIKLQQRKLVALYTTWKNNIEENSNDPNFKSLESLTQVLETYFSVLKIEADLSKPGFDLTKLDDYGSKLNTSLESLQHIKDQLSDTIYLALNQKIFTAKKLLSPARDQRELNNLEVLKPILDLKLPETFDAFETIKVFKSNTTKQITAIDHIIKQENFFTKYLGRYTDEQHVLLNGKLATYLTQAKLNVNKMEARLLDLEKEWLALQQNLHLEVKILSTGDMTSNRIIAKQEELAQKAKDKFVEIAKARAELKSVTMKLDNKFQWLHEQYSRKQQLKVVEQFVRGLNSFHPQLPTAIGELRQLLHEDQKRLEQINLYLLSLPTKEAEASEEFKKEYTKNKQWITRLIDELNQNKSVLETRISVLNTKLPTLQKSELITPVIAQPTKTYEELTVTHANIPLLVEPVGAEFVEAASERSALLSETIFSSPDVIRIQLSANYRESKAAIGAALRAHIDPNVKEYKVDHPDHKICREASIWLSALDKTPLIKNSNGDWTEFKPDSLQGHEIAEKRKERSEQLPDLLLSSPALRR